MKNSLTIKMTLLTLAAFLLTSTLSIAQPGPRGEGRPPRMDAPKSAPKKPAPPTRVSAPSKPAPRPEVHKPAPRPQVSHSAPSRPVVDRAIDTGRRVAETRRPEAPSRGPVAPPSVRPSAGPKPTPSRGPAAPPSVRPTAGPKPTPSRGPAAPPSVRPTAGPRPTPGPSHIPTAGPRPTSGPSHFPSAGPRPTPGPSHFPSAGPRPTPGPTHHVTPGPRPGSGHYPTPAHIPSGIRPSWQTRPHDHFDPIYSSVHRAMYRPNVPPPHAPRPYWNNWGLAVSMGWNSFAISTGAFTLGWWDSMNYRAPWWNYYYYRSSYPVYYWWETPSWNRVCRFYPTYGWTNGFYYDYGENVVVGPDSYVYINGQKVTTQYEYAQSAAELASYNMPNQVPVAGNQTNLQWLPLGTFALSMSVDNPQASAKAAIQLAATNDGLISGSFYNRDNNQTFPIQGRVDPQTQRVAFYVIGAENTVFETGMYNLTQQEAPVMVHMNGGKTTKNCLLVRLTPPQQAAANTITPDAYMEDAVALPFVDNNVSDAEKVVHSILE